MQLGEVLQSVLASPIALALVIAVCVLVLGVPLALRVAGLTGGQIVDVLTLTMQFFVNLVREFRTQNAGGSGDQK